MGNFSWIIIVIVIIQAIAGAVAKASEKRKAQMKKIDASKGVQLKGGLGRSAEAASARKANQKSDLERMRAARIEALRSRGKTKTPAVSAAPVAPSVPVIPVAPAAPVTAAVPAVKAQGKNDGRPSKTREKRAERLRAQEAKQRKRASKVARDYSGITARHEKPQGVEKGSAVSKVSNVVHPDHPSKKTPVSSVPSQPVGMSSEALKSMLSDPESFKKAYILSELIAPPVSMRPPSE